MKNRCKLTREKWELYKNETLPDVREQQAIRKHLQTCSACKAFAYGESLSFFLEEPYREVLQNLLRISLRISRED